jgi:hypothetical protein
MAVYMQNRSVASKCRTARLILTGKATHECILGFLRSLGSPLRGLHIEDPKGMLQRLPLKEEAWSELRYFYINSQASLARNLKKGNINAPSHHDMAACPFMVFSKNALIMTIYLSFSPSK